MGTALEDRRLRGLDRPVSALGAGCWTIGGAATNQGVPIGWDGVDEEHALAGLHRAFELGVTLFDTADVYGHGRSERLLGRLLVQVPRTQVVISSKVGYFAGKAPHPYLPQQMRRQLARTLTNLATDHLDLYFLHSGDFGPDDRYLQPAVEQMRAFVAQGLIRAVGMHAPNSFAVEWANGDHEGHEGRHAVEAARFLRLFDAVNPDVVIARYNLLSPVYTPGETDVFELARTHGVGVIIKQALGQGVLLGAHPPSNRRPFGPGDHRCRDPMFTPQALRTVYEGLAPVRERHGDTVTDLARIALRYALARDPAVPVLVGFRDAAQISTTIGSLGGPLARHEIAWLRHSLAPLRDTLAQQAPTAPHRGRPL